MQRSRINVFEIKLDRPDYVYQSGETLTGHLSMQVQKEIKIREIRVTFLGDAKVHWTETYSTGQGSTTTVHYHSEQTYFEQTVIVFKGPEKETILQPNSYMYPFSYTLPQGLCNPFEARHGRVRYQVKAVVDIPFSLDKKTNVPFSVFVRKDLNSLNGTKDKFDSTEQKTICCCCCQSGPIVAEVHLDKTGYVPGEALRVNVAVSNSSNRPIKKIVFKLEQFITFKTSRKNNHSRITIGTISRTKPISGGEVVQWTDSIQIPPVPPSDDDSNQQTCSIMDVVYKLQMRVVPSGPAVSLKINKIPIIIGNVPLNNMFYNMPPPELKPTPHKRNVVDIQPMPPPAMPTGVPPVSYSQSATTMMFKDKDEDKDNQDYSTYIPKYSYYDWGNTPGPAKY